MTTITQSITELRSAVSKGTNWRFFLEDNLTGSWMQTAWIFFLTLITAIYTIRQLEALPVSTIIILVLWVVGVSMVALGALLHRHTNVSRWLKNHLLSSISNTILTLLLVLILISAVYGIWQWGITNATFNSAETSPEFQPDDGATWGVIWAARKLLMTGLLPPEFTWRVWLSLGFIVAMWLVTFVSGRSAMKERLGSVRMVSNGLWLLSPIILYIFLAGVPNNPYSLTGVLAGIGVLLATYVLFWSQKVVRFSWLSLGLTAAAWPVLYTIWWGIGRSEVFIPINVDNWGGFLLTMIVASSVIVLSLPLGMVLALARRSEVYGIPSWILWPVAIVATIMGFTTTPELLATSRNTFEQIISFWPVLILVVAYMIQSMFQGNIVAGASTTFIELIRSVPLITLLFMGIVMAPFFFETGTSIAKPWPVIVGYTLFSSAYMAETIRGGLQSIPEGQFEAADALGFNTLQKMRFIILPQALRVVIPAIVGQFIGAYKSSSLVSIVGLWELVGITKAIQANPEWQGLRLELVVFLALVYFFGSSVMSSYSRRLESRLGVGER